jgi:hypothetical protein
MMRRSTLEHTGVKASIHWLTEAEGGRNQLPTSLCYSTVARFSQQKNWPDQAWSIVAEFNELPTITSTARVRFLVDNAPHDLLRSGATFELLEGHKVVATVQVID